jgi:hypothetical protein
MCAWPGHQVFVLTVTYAGGRTRQFSVRRERVAEVRRWLENYQKLKQAIEAICELRSDFAALVYCLFKGHQRDSRRPGSGFGLLDDETATPSTESTMQLVSGSPSSSVPMPTGSRRLTIEAPSGPSFIRLDRRCNIALAIATYRDLRIKGTQK